MKDELATKEGEFEKILSLAEELQENCDRYSNRISMFRVVEFTTILLCIIIVLFLSNFNIFYFYGLLSVLVSILIILASFEYIIVRNHIKRLRRDSRALSEIVGLLRELGEFQGVKEDWSELDKAQYRIRLSRFGIGDSDFLHRNFMSKSEGYKYNNNNNKGS